MIAIQNDAPIQYDERYAHMVYKKGRAAIAGLNSDKIHSSHADIKIFLIFSFFFSLSSSSAGDK